MITELTPKQQEELEEYKQEWLKIGFCTDPANKQETIECISEIYKENKLNPPKFIFCTSPESVYAMVSLFKSEHLKAAEKLITTNDSIIGKDFIAQHFPDFKTKSDESSSIFFGGQCEGYWISFYCFCEHLGVSYSKESTRLLHLWERLAKSSFVWAPFSEYCFVSDRPSKIRVNQQNLLHHFDLPAVEFADGYKRYFIHGTRIPEYFVLTPKEKIDPKKIFAERNAEVRMRVIQKVGASLYKKMKSKNIDSCSLSEDKNNTLLEMDIGGAMVRGLRVTWTDKFSDKETFLPVPTERADFNTRWQELYGKDWEGNPNSARDVSYWTWGIPPGTPILQHT